MMKNILTTLIILTLCSFHSCKNNIKTEVSGEMKRWHPVTLTFTGPETSEFDTINPFTDYRLDVEFTGGDQKFAVPGYFAADGNAGETSERIGNKWRVHFSPPFTGKWEYNVSFVTGHDIAISDNPGSGQGCFMNGEKGEFTIAESDSTEPGFFSKGRLIYDGSRYLKHAGTGEPFLKGGTDSPENLLGYKDFDGTYYGGNNKTRAGEATPNNGLHTYEPHLSDWKEGDPSWKNGKGKGLIGGLNYLSSKGVNSIYFLTLNILGDGEDVWPYTDRNERYRFDCSKLDQWEIVFSHADNLGMMLQIVLQETENQCLLDCGKVDVQRKVYLRELVARFAHHLAITWNLGEEQHAASFSPYGQTYDDTKSTANYLRKMDPYKNFIVIHTHSNTEKRREDMAHYLGFKNVEGPSLQCGNIDDVHGEAKFFTGASAGASHQWVVCQDEIGQHWKGALPDSYDPAHDTIRYKVLWGNLMAGGAGVEWYFGYKYPQSDLSCEDWRSRDLLWDQTKIALNFFHSHLPFTQMKSADELINGLSGYCLAKEGELYAVYLPEGKPATLNLPQGRYNISWFNPRAGGDLMPGSITTVSGNGQIPTGKPPVDDGKDWVCLVRAEK